jgi:bifunctional non-homologous end joining protein LigD
VARAVKKVPPDRGLATPPQQDRASLVPAGHNEALVRVQSRNVHLTNLLKPFWPDLGVTKGDLLRYYERIAPVLLPHLRNRAMVMKRYPNGAAGPFFFMKRTPAPHPSWLQTCAIEHASGNIINFPVIQDLASLLWVVNLGCIDLNPWYARCDDVDRPDYLHFDLDPVPPATFATVRKVALRVRDGLRSLGIEPLAKTSGSKGMHIYVPIVRGPTQKAVWGFSKTFAQAMEAQHPDLVTAEYRISNRPAGRVLVDYNQNAWGRTLASIYSVRPHPRAAVSTPLAWEEIEGGVTLEQFRIDTVPARVEAVGDLWAPLLSRAGRINLERLR